MEAHGDICKLRSFLSVCPQAKKIISEMQVKKKEIITKKKKINKWIKFTQNAERQSALKKERVVHKKQYGGRR